MDIFSLLKTVLSTQGSKFIIGRMLLYFHKPCLLKNVSEVKKKSSIFGFILRPILTGFKIFNTSSWSNMRIIRLWEIISHSKPSSTVFFEVFVISIFV